MIKTFPSMKFFLQEIQICNQNFSISSKKKVMGVQSKVGRASRGQIDAVKLNLPFFCCLPVLT